MFENLLINTRVHMHKHIVLSNNIHVTLKVRKETYFHVDYNGNINNYDLLYCVKLQLKCMLILYQATTSMMTASQISFFSFSSTPTEIHLEVALLFLNIAYVLLKKKLIRTLSFVFLF